MTHELLAVSDFCARYGISRTQLYREAAAGRIQFTKIGRSTRVDRVEAEKWRAALPKSGNIPVKAA